MTPAPARNDEPQALAALRALAVLDSPPEAEFDALVRAVSLACGAPIALISLIDAQRQWFKANIGLPGVSQTPRDVSFCAHTVLTDDLFEITDARADPRFADNPLVTGAPHIRFYAGAPIRLSSGLRVGTLCVIDHQPRLLQAPQREILQCLATAVAQALESRQASLLLWAQSQRLAHLIDGADVGTWEWVLSSGALRINARFAQMVGVSADRAGDTTVQAWRGRVHPDDWARAKALLKQHVAGQTDRFVCELRVRHEDGHWVWVMDQGRVIGHGAHGQPDVLFGTRWDISERKHQQAALQRSEAFLDRTGRVAGVGGWEIDIASGTFTWSDETRRIHGVAPDYQPVLAEAVNFYAPQARPVIEAAVQRGLSHGEPWDLELPLVRADGRPIWARVVGSVEFVDGKTVRLFGAFQDITELRKSREALRQLTVEQAAMLDTEVMGIARVRQRRFVWVNRGVQQLLGYAPDELLGQSAARLYANPQDYQRVGEGLAAAQSAGRPLRVQLEFLHKNGQTRWVDLSTVALPESGGESLVLILDITAQRLAEAARTGALALDAENQQLRTVGRLKDQLLANMSHELRTPLNAVIGFAQLLQSGAVAPASAKFTTYLGHIDAGGRQLLQLIETLLDCSEAESGRIEFQPEPVRLADAIADVITMARASHAPAMIDIAMQGAHALRDVQVDALRLRQVLFSLVGNALKFSGPGAPVVGRARADRANQFCIEVEDQGIGIAQADLPLLFSLFHQVSAGHTKTHAGMGLGLALVRRLVQAQGGSVGVRSQLGVGSVFHFCLPCRPQVPAGERDPIET